MIMKKYKEFVNENDDIEYGVNGVGNVPIEDDDILEVVKEYEDKYDGNQFFRDFVEYYGNEKGFKEDLLDNFFDEPDDDVENWDEWSDEEQFDELWSPEDVVYCLSQRIDTRMPEPTDGHGFNSEVWVNFHNDLNATSWYNKNINNYEN